VSGDLPDVGNQLFGSGIFDIDLLAFALLGLGDGHGQGNRVRTQFTEGTSFTARPRVAATSL
jgi:hypothetical protein